MAVIITEGIILRKYLLRETSYILIVYTKDFGKIRGVIKGVRKPYPQFAGDFELFTRCDIRFYQKKKNSLDLITQCVAVDPFFRIRDDIERLTYANYFIELIDVVALDYDKNDKLYQALIDALGALASGADIKSIGMVFKIKFIDALGVGLQLEECVSCSEQVADKKHLDISNGGLVCGKCCNDSVSSVKVSPGTINFLRKISNTPFKKTSNIKMSSGIVKETENVLEDFIRHYTGKDIKSLKFLRQIEANGVLGVAK